MTDRIMEWLDESQQLADKATEGPWEADLPGEVSQHWSRPEPWASVVSCEVTCMAYCYGGRAEGAARDEDAEFIAESRTRFPQAIAALRAVSELHRPVMIYAHEDACESESEDHQQEHHVEFDVGEYYCDTMPLYQVCSTCLDGYGNQDVEYPCETYRAVEAALGLEGDDDD